MPFTSLVLDPGTWTLDPARLTCTQLELQPPISLVCVMYACRAGLSLGRSKKQCRVDRTTGTVPVILHLGLISSMGFSRLPQPSHWSPRASCRVGGVGVGVGVWAWVQGGLL